MMKICKRCKIEKKVSEFYKHSGMADGYLSFCKDCTKTRVAKHRAKNIDQIREYDRARGNRQSKEYVAEYRKKFPNKYKATTAVNNAIRDGKLKIGPCEVCGKKSAHGHHDDYSKPLSVRWLCAAHHRQWHIENGGGKNP